MCIFKDSAEKLGLVLLQAIEEQRLQSLVVVAATKINVV